MQVNLIFDFFKSKPDIRFKSLFEVIGPERLKPIISKIAKSSRWDRRWSEYEAMDAIVHAFPFLETDKSLSYLEEKQICAFISLIEDLGTFYDLNSHAPQKRYKGLNNLGKRYSNFVMRHSNTEEKTIILVRYLGLADLPEPIQWHDSNRLSKLNKLYENAWLVNFGKLVEYHKYKGSCNISINNTELAFLRRWCYRQLNLFNEGKLFHERMEKLKDLGFFEDYGKQDIFNLVA